MNGAPDGSGYQHDGYANTLHVVVGCSSSLIRRPALPVPGRSWDMFKPPAASMAGLDLQTRVILAYDTVFTLFVGGLAVLLVGYLITSRHIGS